MQRTYITLTNNEQEIMTDFILCSFHLKKKKNNLVHFSHINNDFDHFMTLPKAKWVLA